MRISELSAEISNAERFHSAFLRQRRKPARWKKKREMGENRCNGTILVILREFWSSGKVRTLRSPLGGCRTKRSSMDARVWIWGKIEHQTLSFRYFIRCNRYDTYRTIADKFISLWPLSKTKQAVMRHDRRDIIAYAIPYLALPLRVTRSIRIGR